MIEYDTYGEASGCSYEYDGKDVDPDTAAEIEKAITEGVTSLRDRVRYLERSIVAAEHQRDQAIKSNDTATRTALTLLDFVEWVHLNAEDGIPAHALTPRARKALNAALAVRGLAR